MNENRTASILQRFAIVLTVTAASYGLPQTQAQARIAGNGSQHTSAHSLVQQQR
jgi:hypothetical protein